VASCFSLAQAVGYPLQGRLLDRYGLVVLRAAGLVGPALLAVSAFLIATDVPRPVMIITVASAGLTMPATQSVTRSTLPTILSDPALERATLSLDAVSLEFALLVGPTLTTLLAVLVAPIVPVMLGVGLTSVGSLALASALAPYHEHQASKRTDRRTIWRQHRFIATACGAALQAAAVAGVEFAIPAISVRSGHTALGGVYLSLIACGSLLGGLAWGLLRWRPTLQTQYGITAVAMFAGFAALALAHNVPTLAALAFLAGLPLSSSVTVSVQVIRETAAPTVITETFAWLAFAGSVGWSLGYLLLSLLLPAVGTPVAFLTAALLALISAPVFLATSKGARP
jgi:MFS family permease